MGPSDHPVLQNLLPLFFSHPPTPHGRRPGFPMAEFDELNTALREHGQQVRLDILRRAHLIGVSSHGSAFTLPPGPLVAIAVVLTRRCPRGGGLEVAS